MIDNLTKYLPREIEEFYKFVKSLKVSKDDWKYHFMCEDEFAKITDPAEGGKIYWTEMLYRCHIVSLVSLFKIARWLEAMDNNIENYYGFCSNLRSLIETCADSFYSLQSVPLTIANDYKVIYKIIKKQSPILLTHEKLETTLLHFIDGTKLNKEDKQKFPEYFNAKHITEYLKTFKDGNDMIINLYRYLCGISHPASESSQMFLFLYKGETYVCGDSYQLEANLVESLINENSDALVKMFRIIAGNICCILKLLNLFPVPLIYSDFKNDNIIDYKPWKEIQKLMESSIIKFENGIKSHIYE